jgi:hypothetical protein
LRSNSLTRARDEKLSADSPSNAGRPGFPRLSSRSKKKAKGLPNPGEQSENFSAVCFFPFSSAPPVMAQILSDPSTELPSRIGPDVDSSSRIRRPKPAAPQQPSPLQFVIPAPVLDSGGTASTPSQAPANPPTNSAPDR